MPPIYDFACPCGKTEERFAKIDERELPCACGKPMKRLISSTHAVHADFASKDFVTDNITGSPVRITSNRQLKNLLKENNLTQKIGKGWY